MKVFDVGIKGIQPLFMHSPRGIDPTDPMVRKMKAITSKGSKKKSDSDLAEQDWLEFQLSLYWNGEFVYVPDTAILGSIRAGAQENRRGREVQAGLDVLETEIPLLYDGPRDPQGLYDKRFVDRRPAGVQKARVMRVRARFNSWALAFKLVVDVGVINPADAKQALEIAGARKGLLDHRPRFGRFEVTGWKEAA